MSKMGRPIKGDEARSERLTLRVSPGEAQKICSCADTLGVSRVDAIVKGVDLLADKLAEKGGDSNAKSD